MNKPRVELFVHWSGTLTEGELRWLRKMSQGARDEVMRRYPAGALSELDELEITLVDDASISEVHGKFLNDATATDVITFPHGEILVSVETAAARAEEFGKDLCGETLMYIVHGLLHLAGFDDQTKEEASEMAWVQEEVWEYLVGLP
jgi:probable rRNA maturation factor